MNEKSKLKIEREFSIHCTEKREDGTYVFDKYKFAELIIQKCISITALVGISNFENADISWASHTIIEQTKEHFGVE